MKVFLATPMYSENVMAQFAESLKRSLTVLKENEIEAHWESFMGCCYLPVARNKLVKVFLEDERFKDFTDFVFLDSDIEWEPEALLQLLSHPVDVVGGAYPHKAADEGYPVWYRTDDEHRPVLGGLSGLVECWTIPTGFMRVTRRVFSLMEQHYGTEQLQIDEYSADNLGCVVSSYLNFFDTEKIGSRWWGEDTNFCRRWTMEMNRPLWTDPGIKLTHWGSQNGHDYPFRGDYHYYLSTLPGGANDSGYHGNPIDGFMTLKELRWLFSHAKGKQSIIEIGSYKGRSAHALLSGCTDGTVYCVDPWESEFWNDGANDHIVPATMAEFLENTKQFTNRVAFQATGTAAAERVGDVDMVFIDGAHDYDSVVEDINVWLPKTRKIISGHDYGYAGWPDVKRAVDEIFGDRVQTCGSIWFVELEG